MESIIAKYVSQKISKTRWRPVSHSSLQQPDIFVTGSWDNEVGKFLVNANIILYAKTSTLEFNGRWRLIFDNSHKTMISLSLLHNNNNNNYVY